MSQSPPEQVIRLAVPGMEHVTLTFTADASPVPLARMQAITVILGELLRDCGSAPTPKQVRFALRQIHTPQYLGDTTLAHLLFDHISMVVTRGNAVRSLLLHAIEQLDSGSAVDLEQSRGYIILRRLYVEGAPRIVIALELGLSERQYQRELQRAIERLTAIIGGML